MDTSVKSLPTRGLILLGQFRKGPCPVPIQKKRLVGQPGNVQAQINQGVVPEQVEKQVLGSGCLLFLLLVTLLLTLMILSVIGVDKEVRIIFRTGLFS